MIALLQDFQCSVFSKMLHSRNHHVIQTKLRKVHVGVGLFSGTERNPRNDRLMSVHYNKISLIYDSFSV